MISDKQKEYQKKYRQTDKFKEARKRYLQSDKCKEAQKKYRQTDNGRKVRKKACEKFRQKMISADLKTIPEDVNELYDKVIQELRLSG